ncbi:RedV protein [Streptomyces sp. NPDC013178]|uniref:RedV protein n=1 Tax=unclassified Streptomyces TaxID=2593676 RepID=UPI0033E677BF
MLPPSSCPAPSPARPFPEALDEATRCAALSPSSHNCQPWGLARAVSGPARAAAAAFLGLAEDDAGQASSPPGGTEYLALALDRRRHLVALPAHAVEMGVSCGAYWRVLLRALAAQGWAPVRSRTAEEPGACPFGAVWPREWSLLCVVALRRGAASDERVADLAATARERRTNRSPYRTAPLDPGLLEHLARPAHDAEGSGGIDVRHLTDPTALEAFAALLARHAGRDFAHHRAWRETHSFLRWSEAHAHGRGDGFTLTQLFGPMSRPHHLARRLALAPSAMRVLCRAGYDRRLAAGLAALARRSPAVVAMGFTGVAPGPADVLRGGARLVDHWLRATRSGLALHPISVLLQHDDLRHEARTALGLPGHTFFLARLGRPTVGSPPAPRCADAAQHRPI